MKVFKTDLPGRLVTADEQCKQQYGKGNRHCQYKLVNKNKIKFISHQEELWNNKVTL